MPNKAGAHQSIAIEPVFEADLRECSYGFQPKRSAKQALEVVRDMSAEADCIWRAKRSEPLKD